MSKLTKDLFAQLAVCHEMPDPWADFERCVDSIKRCGSTADVNLLYPEFVLAVAYSSPALRSRLTLGQQRQIDELFLFLKTVLNDFNGRKIPFAKVAKKICV